MTSSSSTSNKLFLSTESATKYYFDVDVQASGHKQTLNALTRKKVQNAVYGYIRAVRALGKTEINTVQIAKALSLSPEDVKRAVTTLKKKGVRPKHG